MRHKTQSHKLAKTACLEHIAAHQGTHGGFPGISGEGEILIGKPQPITFVTSLILLALSKANDIPEVKSIADRGADFLLNQKSKAWSWNYYERNSAEFCNAPYPDDLDDTACALAALTLYKKDIVDGHALAAATKLLIGTEDKEGGPYHTWIVPPEHRARFRDIDLGVNANIGYFLRLHGIHLRNLIVATENAIRREDFASKYYFSPYPTLYFISRFYSGSLVERAATYLFKRRRKNGLWDNPLSTALAVSALLSFGVPRRKLLRAVEHLELYARKKDWKAYPLYIEKKKEGKVMYSGSSALTAAFIFEAIHAYHSTEEDVSSIEQQASFSKATKLHNLILEGVGKRFESLSAGMQHMLKENLDKVLLPDTNKQNTLLPFYFARSIIKHGSRVRISEDALLLGQANVYGWMAYRIYDDLLDDEGDPLNIPFANLCLRELSVIYTELIKSEHASLFREVMDKLDEANRWERDCCRMSMRKGVISITNFPDYGNHSVLAEKSLGHALGPLVFLIRKGYSLQSKEVGMTMAFFKHYLIARQLNDDAHDWFIDLKRGYINSAGVRVLKIWKKKTFSVEESKEALEMIFWKKVITGISNDILREIAFAREALYANSIIVDKSYCEKILLPVERAAKKALLERKQALEFLESYS